MQHLPYNGGAQMMAALLDGLHGHGTARLIRRLGALNQLGTPAASVFARGLRTSLT